jgi:hypothetical protein
MAYILSWWEKSKAVHISKLKTEQAWEINKI